MTWLRPDAEERLAPGLFLRGLGLVYVAAFASAGVQLPGLVGPTGITPALELVAAHREAGFGPLDLPTLAWGSASDLALLGTAALGGLCGLALAAGSASLVALGLAWALYLSIVTAGGSFFAFQWDNLLLEAGLLALMFGRLHPTAPPRASGLGLALLRLLLFRLVFSSGVVKFLTSGDPSWSSGTALEFHYFTQPLPNPLAYYAHHLPRALHRLSVVGVVLEQLLLPWLLFAPGRLRAIGGAAMIAFQLLVLATGNYGWFNLLAIALAAAAFDDPSLARGARGLAWLRLRPAEPGGLRVVRAVFGGALLALAALTFARTLELPPSPAARAIHRALAPFRSVSTYGLFAVMTTSRVELELEGSDDGVEFRPYVFPYKPGPVDRAPPQCVPHLPRLDWLMWFAALSDVERSPWIPLLVRRLLEGSPAVLARFEAPPRRPPRLVRVVAYDVTFSDPAERRASGVVWRRAPRGVVVRPLSLEDFAGLPR